MRNLASLAVTTVDRMQVLRSWLDPEHSAVLVIDMQEEFTHPESNVARWISTQMGADISTLPPFDPSGPTTASDPDLDEIPSIRKLIQECRRLGVQVIWVVTRITEETNARFWRTVGLRNCFEGEWCERISAGLEPLPGESIVYKTRHSGFYKTDLESTLAEKGITTVIATGRATSGCVEATCRDATARDLGVVLVADCCGPPGPNHEADVLKIGRFFGFAASSDEVIEILKAARKAEVLVRSSSLA